MVEEVVIKDVKVISVTQYFIEIRIPKFEPSSIFVPKSVLLIHYEQLRTDRRMDLPVKKWWARQQGCM